MSPSDAELVRASLRDPNAYGAIVRRYDPPLRRYMSRLLRRNSQQMDDVLQEVFLKAYVNLNDYDQGRSFSPWIYRIAHNEAISALRKRRVEPQTISGEDGLLLIDRVAQEPEMASDFDSSHDEARLRAALAALESKYREVIVLRYLEEKSYEDIADILAVPMGTVATLLSRGKLRLRKTLGELDRGGARVSS